MGEEHPFWSAVRPGVPNGYTPVAVGTGKRLSISQPAYRRQNLNRKTTATTSILWSLVRVHDITTLTSIALRTLLLHGFQRCGTRMLKLYTIQHKVLLVHPELRKLNPPNSCNGNVGTLLRVPKFNRAKQFHDISAYGNCKFLYKCPAICCVYGAVPGRNKLHVDQVPC